MTQKHLVNGKKKMKTNINSMSKKELIDLVSNLINEQEIRLTHINKVSVCDVEVESNVESLDNCKSVVNDLIKHNQKFITLRNNKIKADNLGYFS